MLKLPAVFSDRMVLQRNKNIAVWGISDAPMVEARIGDVCESAVVKNGRWSLFLPPMDAGGPYEMTVLAGDDSISYDDVMIGEVWLAGGQSNMEFELQNSKGGSDAAREAAGCDVRFYRAPQVSWVGEELYEAEKKSAWEKPDSKNCGTWSAVGYYFAKRLSERLKTAVGVIGCNWGGTSASCWIGRSLLEQNARISPYLKEYDDAVKNQDLEEYLREREEYIVYQAEFDKNVGRYYETSPRPSWEEAIKLFGENRYPGPMGPRNETRPCGLYESMLKRVAPYTLAGFIYYQGEEDDHRPETYFDLLSALVLQWRRDWDDISLPFMLVQLPMFANDGEPDYKNWPLIREAQMRVYDCFKNTGIAVALDLGEYGNIHPANKKPVGERLAMQALYHVYGLASDEEAFGPIFKSYYIRGGEVHIIFDHANGGLLCTADEERGFEIAGDDGKYHGAKAKIRGCEAILTSEEVEAPKYARYRWTNYGEVTLFGKNKIPAAPFRTSVYDGAKYTGSRKAGLIVRTSSRCI